MKIKHIFDEIKNESSTKKKVEILSKYKDNELLKKVLYLTDSPRVKFYIKQIPAYVRLETRTHTLEGALMCLELLSTRSVTGHEAIEHLRETLMCCEPDDAHIIERIIEKDCKINLGTSLINKVFPDLIEETGYMGAKAYDLKLVNKLLDKDYVLSQTKMDGRYCNVVIEDGFVKLESRQGEVTRVEGAMFLKELENFGDCVLNGELTMPGKSRYESNGIIASLISIGNKKYNGDDVTKDIVDFEKEKMPYQQALDEIVFTVWDRITIEEYVNKSSKTPYKERLELLNVDIKNHSDFKSIQIIETRELRTLEEVLTHFNEVVTAGGEGTIIKSPDGEWVDSKPNWQIKIKLEMDVDLKIVGFNYGTGKNSNVISSLNAESSDGLVKTKPTGIDEKTMKMITENQDKLLGTIVEVKCSGLSFDRDGNHSLLHPVFKKLRDDKNTCDSLGSIKEIENMSKQIKK
jgi:hypothetical protein